MESDLSGRAVISKCHIINRSGMFDNSKLIWAFNHGYPINHVDMNGYTPLMAMIIDNNSFGVELLLSSYGINPNIPIEYHDNHRTSENTYPLLKAVRSTTCILKLIINNNHGINLNVQSVINANTALHIAVGYKQYDNALLLLKSGIDPNIVNLSNKTALSLAIQKSDLKMVKLLLENGACPVHRTSFDDTPLHSLNIRWPQHRIQIVKLLLEYGADPHATNIMGISPYSMLQTHFSANMTQITSDTKKAYDDMLKLYDDYILPTKGVNG